MGGTGSLVSQRCYHLLSGGGVAVFAVELVGSLEQDNHWPGMSSSGVIEEEGCDLQSAIHGLQQCLHWGNK